MEPYEGMEPYIFTSYARKDWERVKPFLDALSDAGYRVWYDAGIQAGADWLDTLLEKVENCAVFCPLFSEAFKDSYYCSEETKWAYRKKKTIVPLHLEKMKPDGLPRLYELLQGRQDLRLYEYADAAQFAERLGRENAFALCMKPKWNKIGQIQWRLSSDGVLEIVKNEDLPEKWYSYASIPPYQYDPVHRGSTAPWMLYREKIFSVSIGNNIDEIGDYAFIDCEALTDVSIPNGVTKIGNNAFWGCKSLIDLRISDSINEIGYNAFTHCSRLTDVSIPDSVTEIGYSVFAYCSSLTDVHISNGVTKIGDNTFANCSRLTDVSIPDGVTKIGDWAFDSCLNLENVRIPNGVTEIGSWAFRNCENLKSVEIPVRAKVGKDAFPQHTRIIRRDAPQ